MKAFYIKKSPIVEAIQYTGDNLRDCTDFSDNGVNWRQFYSNFEDFQNQVDIHGSFAISPSEDEYLRVKKNDWIVKYTSGAIEVYNNEDFKLKFYRQ